jgi:hypothetical protein
VLRIYACVQGVLGSNLRKYTGYTGLRFLVVFICPCREVPCNTFLRTIMTSFHTVHSTWSTYGQRRKINPERKKTEIFHLWALSLLVTIYFVPQKIVKETSPRRIYRLKLSGKYIFDLVSHSKYSPRTVFTRFVWISYVSKWWGGINWIHVTLDTKHWRALVNTAMNFRAPWHVGKFLSSWATGGFSRMTQFQVDSCFFKQQ